MLQTYIESATALDFTGPTFLDMLIYISSLSISYRVCFHISIQIAYIQIA